MRVGAGAVVADSAVYGVCHLSNYVYQIYHRGNTHASRLAIFNFCKKLDHSVGLQEALNDPTEFKQDIENALKEAVDAKCLTQKKADYAGKQAKRRHCEEQDKEFRRVQRQRRENGYNHNDKDFNSAELTQTIDGMAQRQFEDADQKIQQQDAEAGHELEAAAFILQPEEGEDDQGVDVDQVDQVQGGAEVDQEEEIAEATELQEDSEVDRHQEGAQVNQHLEDSSLEQAGSSSQQIEAGVVTQHTDDEGNCARNTAVHIIWKQVMDNRGTYKTQAELLTKFQKELEKLYNMGFLIAAEANGANDDLKGRIDMSIEEEKQRVAAVVEVTSITNQDLGNETSPCPTKMSQSFGQGFQVPSDSPSPPRGPPTRSGFSPLTHSTVDTLPRRTGQQPRGTRSDTPRKVSNYLTQSCANPNAGNRRQSGSRSESTYLQCNSRWLQAGAILEDPFQEGTRVESSSRRQVKIETMEEEQVLQSVEHVGSTQTSSSNNDTLSPEQISRFISMVRTPVTGPIRPSLPHATTLSPLQEDSPRQAVRSPLSTIYASLVTPGSSSVPAPRPVRAESVPAPATPSTRRPHAARSETPAPPPSRRSTRIKARTGKYGTL